MPQSLRALLVLLAAIPTLMTARRIWHAFPDSILTDNFGTVFQDYIVMWVSGRTVLAGQTPLLATTEGFNSQIATLIGPGVYPVNWAYPPTMLLLSTPLAALPPFASMALWVVLTSTALWFALRWTGLPLLARLAVMFAPSALENAVDGQNAALMTACAIGAIVKAEQRPWLAGMFLSVAVVKPQMAIVAPVCLLAARYWRALLWGGLFASGWIALTGLCFGVATWVDYFTSIVPSATSLYLGLDDVPFGTLYLQDLMVTPFAAFRTAGLGTGMAQALQLGVSLIVLGYLASVVNSARRGRRPLPVGVALAAVPLVTPYAMTYDMIGPTIAAALLLQSRLPNNAFVLCALVAWAWPCLSVYVGSLWLPGLGAIVFAGLAAAVVACDRRSSRASAIAPPSRPPFPRAIEQSSLAR